MSIHTFKDFLRFLRLRLRVFLGQDVYFAPQIRVSSDRVGGRPENGYGSWTTVTDGLGPDSIVYSFGVGDDISFDLDLIARTGATVHAFDPTAASMAWLRKQDVPRRFIHHAFAVTAQDGPVRFHANPNPDWVSSTVISEAGSPDDTEEVAGRRLSTLMATLGHDRIDLLKLDIEGAEYDVIRDLIDSEIRVQQILVEFHHRFPTLSIEQTRTALQSLIDAGFQIFAVSPTGEEYSLLASRR